MNRREQRHQLCLDWIVRRDVLPGDARVRLAKPNKGTPDEVAPRLETAEWLQPAKPRPPGDDKGPQDRDPGRD